jgi:hypothetical protein
MSTRIQVLREVLDRLDEVDLTDADAATRVIEKMLQEAIQARTAALVTPGPTWQESALEANPSKSDWYSGEGWDG